MDLWIAPAPMARPLILFATALAAALSEDWVSCSSKPDPSVGEPPRARSEVHADDGLAPLREFEQARRSAADFAHLPPSNTVTGADPIAIRALPAASLLVGLLRGRDALVVLDTSLREIQRLAAPASPTGLAVGGDGDVFVSGERSGEIARYRILPRVDSEATNNGRSPSQRAAARLERSGTLDLKDVRAIRDVAVGPEGALYVVEEYEGRLITLTFEAEAGRGRERLDSPEAARQRPPPLAIPVGGAGARSRPAAGQARSNSLSDRIPYQRTDSFVGSGAMRVLRAGNWVLAGCLLDHTVVARRVDARGVPQRRGEIVIRHDGPIWSFDARETPDGLLVAAGGVEDHPLDRTGGSFGFIDSFAFLYRLDTQAGVPALLHSINVSEHGVITPKVVRLDVRPGGMAVLVTGYGGDRAADLTWGADLATPPSVATWAMPPGTTSVAPIWSERANVKSNADPRAPSGDGASTGIPALEGDGAYANPLLDAWIRAPLSSRRGRGGGAELGEVTAISEPQGVSRPPRSAESKLGEALFFTSLMAPHNRSEGPLSRFTCETCHFEGYVDGRTHHTGRGDVRATTKPLLGLFNNRPHFSRALDPDLATVANSEFRVAGALSDHDPWFSIEVASFPWLSALRVGQGPWSAVALRRALMAFLMDFTHHPSPVAAPRTAWTAIERAGAEVFRDRCESCHAARLSSDDPRSRVPFDAWERLVMAPEGAIVWGSEAYHKTGIVPYVHEKGARVPSLRRLYKKRPYFTDGSARDLTSVLERVRFGDQVFHHGAGDVGGSPAAITGGEGRGAAGSRLDESSRRSLRSFLDLL